MSTKAEGLQEFTRADRIQNFSIVGAGVPRTGTTSLKEALNLLGLGPCYHMSEVIRHSQQHVWKTVADLKAQGKEVEWDRVFSGKYIPSYRSGVDFPMSAHYRELIEYYPNSKVILTVREPEIWYDSFWETVARTSRHHPNCCFTFVTCPTPHAYINHWEKGPAPKRFLGAEALSSKENTIKAYNEWTEQVKRDIPEEKLLVFYPAMGWEPLCKFLDVPIPDVPYPHSNTRKTMKRRLCCMQCIGIVQLIIFPLLILQWICFCCHDGFRDVQKKDEGDPEEGTTIEIKEVAGTATVLTLEGSENLGVNLRTSNNNSGIVYPEAGSKQCEITFDKEKPTRKEQYEFKVEMKNFAKRVTFI